MVGPQLLSGLALGAAALLVTLALGWPRQPGRPWPLGWPLVGAAAGFLWLAPRERWGDELPLAALALLVILAALGEFDRRWAGAGLTLALVAITLGGAYLTLPDTERVLLLFG